jgi:ubiquinone biosynthesis protein
MSMLGKTLAMMEGLGLKLDPEFDIFSVSEPIVQQLKWDMLVPNAEWGEALLRQGVDWSEFAMLLPRASRRLLEKIEQGQPFDVQLLDADKLMSGLGRLVNRLSLSMIIGALVIALSILIATTTDGSPLQSLISAGLVGVVILGIWLMISIIRGK